MEPTTIGRVMPIGKTRQANDESLLLCSPSFVQRAKAHHVLFCVAHAILRAGARDGVTITRMMTICAVHQVRDIKFLCFRLQSIR